MIKIRYTPEPKILGRASLFFAEKKPFIAFVIIFFNIIMTLIFTVMLLKLILVHVITTQELLSFIVCILWLFGRKPLTAKMLTRKMENQTNTQFPMEIEVSDNGIIWHGKKMNDGTLSWRYLKKVYKTQNGYIVPGSVTRFLWVPFDGFKNTKEQAEFESILEKKQVILKHYPNW